MARPSADEAPPERPDIRRYLDYREYLRAMIRHLRATKRAFSYAWFARVAGFRSKSFLKLVADGQRNLSEDSIPRVCKGLGLNADEAEIFGELVRVGQAGSDVERHAHLEALYRLTRTDPGARMQAEHYEVYSSWYAPAIRELVELTDFKDDASWIGRRLRPKIRAEAAARAVKLLERVGLVTRDDEGRLRAAAGRTISTGPLVRSLAVRNFHRAMMERAIESLDEVPQGERNITSLTLPLSRDQYARLCDGLATVRRVILEAWEAEATEAEDEPREVYQLTLMLHPVTQPVKE